jgi:hypothetical protein
MIDTRILADSLNPTGCRATTFLCRMPKFILAEFNKHRVLAGSAASSRARPVWTVLSEVIRDPVYPVEWGENGRGMWAKQELPKSRQWACKLVWNFGRWTAVLTSWALSKLGAHKQVSNRPVEAYSYVNVVATGTDWGNFFNLRCAPDAQPEFRVLAYAMLEKFVNHTPIRLKAGEWHLPFGPGTVDGHGSSRHAVSYALDLVKLSAARCARTSYATADGRYLATPDQDYRLHDKLVADRHWNPLEHQLEAMPDDRRYAQYRGYRPYRKMERNGEKVFPHESGGPFDPQALLAARPGGTGCG